MIYNIYLNFLPSPLQSPHIIKPVPLQLSHFLILFKKPTFISPVLLHFWQSNFPVP